MTTKAAKTILATTVLLLSAPAAIAMPILAGSTSDGGSTWTASDSEGRSARAEFFISEGGFSITLTNLASETSQPNEILAGLFFDFLAGTQMVILNPSSDGVQNITGTLNTSPEPEFGVDWGSNLDGEWAYRNDLDGINGGRGAYGISSTAMDPLSISQPIDPTKSYPPPSTNGAEFGIASGDTSGMVASVDYWAVGQVTIRFMIEGMFDATTIEQVHFLYGTSYEGTKVPEPATLALFGIGLLAIGFAKRKVA